MSTRTLLLVEDNPDDEALTLHAFESRKAACEVIVARDGVEALDYLFGTGSRATAGPCQPAAVLLDINLPKLDGLEVLRRIRADERTRLLPVILLTSSDEESDRLRGYSLGANSYVCKPVGFDDFENTAWQLGEYWLGLNRTAA